MDTDGPARDTDAPSRAEVTSILEAYFEGLRDTDMSAVPFADDVVWDNPVSRREGEPIRGRDNVIAALERAAANMPRIDVEYHVIDGTRACTVLEWENTDGVVFPTVDYFEFEDGRITTDRTYLDLSVLDADAD